MFRATILPIIRSIRPYNAGCSMNHPMSCRPADNSLGVSYHKLPPLPDHRPTAHWVIHTTTCIIQSNAPDDGQNCCPKHVELI